LDRDLARWRDLVDHLLLCAEDGLRGVESSENAHGARFQLRLKRLN